MFICTVQHGVSTFTMNSDSPIQYRRDDKFGYASLADRLAPVLVQKPMSASIVVGVEARWGAGKTSFLNLTRRALEKEHSDVLIFDYRPWLYSTVDALLLGFCVQIAAQIQGEPGEKYIKISKAMVALSGVFGGLTSLPGKYGLAAAAGAAGTQFFAGAAKALKDLAKIDLSNARDKVQHAFDAAGRPVIIIIDDVDRLEPAEIRLLFQFLKAVADFRGVSYLLAYDPMPVEKALSFGGELHGREYLKKFIQLPIRLPRISNLLLQRFFRDSVKHLGNSLTPPLTATEASALESCSELAAFLYALKTPRDVVRLLNAFRLRLDDCRGEVNLDQLLLFILLDLLSPEAVELIRMHPELFLLPMTRHPEFDVVESDSEMSRLFSEEKDKTKARQQLLETLPEADQPVASKLVLHLFEPSNQSEDRYDARRAQSAHGLIKLLYGGTTSLSFSARDAAQFLAGRNRRQILQEIVSSGVLTQWIYFLSSITDSAGLKNPRGIARSLINAVKTESATTYESAHRLVAEYLAEVFQKLSTQRERKALLDFVASQQTNLFIGEYFLLKVAKDAGLWANGRSFTLADRQSTNEPERVPAAAILNAQIVWLANVKTAALADTLHKHPHLGSILHRWGQFNNNDYTEVQNYVSNFSANRDPLPILIDLGLGTSTKSLTKIVVDPSGIAQALSRYSSEDPMRTTALSIMTHWEKLAQEGDNSEAA